MPAVSDSTLLHQMRGFISSDNNNRKCFTGWDCSTNIPEN